MQVTRASAFRARAAVSLWVVGLAVLLVVVVATRLDWAQSTIYLQLHSFGDTRGVTVCPRSSISTRTSAIERG